MPHFCPAILLPLFYRLTKGVFPLFVLAKWVVGHYKKTMRYRRQMLLDPSWTLPTMHGGELSKGKRKVRRPFSSKRAIHIVLRSSMAKGPWSLLLFGPYIRILLGQLSKKFSVTVYQSAIVSSHVHILLRAKEERGFKKFLMALSGRIAQHITKARKGFPLKARFWDNIPFTRLVNFGRAFEIAKRYVLQNTLEALGVIPYTPRALRPNTS